MSSKYSLLVETIKATSWPVVVLMVIGIFYSPLHRTLDTLSRRSSNIESLKLGQLELNIRVGDLPIPSAETAQTLASFDERMFTQLLSITGSDGPCFPGNEFTSEPRYIAFSKLAELKQIEFTAEPEINDFCENPHSVDLTEAGKETRIFLINLLTSQIQRG